MRHIRLNIYIVLLLGLGLTGVKAQSTGTFTDSRDGNVYNWVKIGNQVWMAQNLAYLPGVTDAQTGSDTTPYYYVYGYEGTDVAAAKATDNYSTYGVLYNWPASKDACPAGWHLPGDDEWTELENYLAENGYRYDGAIGSGREKIAKAMASAGGWQSHSRPGAPGNTDYPEYQNKSGFNALPAGYRYSSFIFMNAGYDCWFWSATEAGGSVWYRFLGTGAGNVIRESLRKQVGFSVRCVMN